jgi:hypothetical protein
MQQSTTSVRTAVHESTAERNARLAKALRLADVLESAGAEPADVEHLSDEAWAQATDLAGVRAPSETTKARVQSILTERARTMTTAEHGHLFEGWAA